MRRSLAVLVALLLPATAARAQSLEDYDYEDLSFRGASVDFGRIFPTKVEPAAVYTIRVDLGYLGPYVRLSPSFAYWSSTLRKSELERLADRLNELGADVDADALGPIDWSSFSLNFDAQVVGEVTRVLLPYAGLGFGVHVLNGDGPAIEDTFVEDSLDGVAAAASVHGGIQLVVTDWFRLHAEARYTVMSDVRYGSLHVGGGFELPSPISGATR